MSQLPDELSRAVHCATLTPMQLPDSTSPEEQFQAAMLASDLNITVAPDIVFDSKIHRFDPNGRSRTDCPGWYIAFAPDINISIHAGAFGNWRESDKGINWHESGRQISDAEAIEITRRYNEAYKKRKQEEERKQASAKKKANEIWTSSSEAPDSHPYLVSKSVKSHGVRVTSENPPRLIMPIHSSDGEIMSLQYISGTPDEKGKFEKRLLHGGKKAGGFFTINGDTNTVYVCEGYATGASIHEATGGLVVIAIDAYNLANVAPLIKGQYAKSNITFVADNDASGVGLKKATEAAEKISARVIMPPVIGQDANDYAKQYGVDKLRELLAPSEQYNASNTPAALASEYPGLAFNMDSKGGFTPISSPLPAIGASSAAMPTEIPVTQDIPAASLAMPQSPATTLPTQANATITNTIPALLNRQSQEPLFLPLDTFCAGRGHSRWLVKNVIKRGGLHMIFGPSGSGKSFFAISLAMTIAHKELNTWFDDYKVHHGNVFYIAGEGHDGIATRCMGLAQYQGLDLKDYHNSLFISTRGALLSEGHYTDVAKEIDELVQRGFGIPDLIIVDTLHNAMTGNENDAKDVGDMLNCCKMLIHPYNSALLFIHHTGVNSDAQNRARGSSSWEAALDLSFVCTNDGDAITFKGKKHKDGTPIKEHYFSLRAVTLQDPITLETIEDEDGDAIETRVLEWTPTVARVSSKWNLTPAQEKNRKLFEELILDRGQLEEGGRLYITRGEFRAEFIERRSKDPKVKSYEPNALKKAFNDAFNRLIGIDNKDDTSGVLTKECKDGDDTRVYFTDEYLSDNPAVNVLVETRKKKLKEEAALAALIAQK